MALARNNNFGLLAQQNQHAPGKDENPPNKPGIINENDTSIDPATLQNFHKNFALGLQPPGLTSEGLPQLVGFELWKTSGNPELVQTLLH